MGNRESFRCALLMLIPACCWMAPEQPAAADWPTYRGDGRRSGYTSQTLPTELSLRWTYKSRHVPRAAWSGRDTRMQLDRAYHPVIAGGTLFFGSSADGKVYALDAATGAQRWTFFTGGPCRFAPAVWKDRLLVVSDDGFLYCLAADDGRLLWKLCGIPSEGRGRCPSEWPGVGMVLGNDRMTSRWPARGGPVIADDVVYFAAGIWPSEGIFLYAVDAATGKVLWCNDTAGSIEMPQPHPGANARSGISAQGNLVVAGDRLLVPTGRAVPAAFRRNDGQFLYFYLQANRFTGGSEIVASDSLFFNGDCVFDVASGDLVGKGISTSAVAVTPEGIVHGRGNAVLASTLAPQEVVDRRGNKSTRIAPGDPTLVTNTPHETLCSLIVAGNTIVAGGQRSVSVLDRTSKRIVFTAEVDGVPYGLAAAGGRLLVATDRGTIYCFAAGTASEPKVIEANTVAAPYADGNPFDVAGEEIIRRCGVTEGYCVDLGCLDGALAYAMAKRTNLHVYAVDPDPANVALARRKLDAAGLYGVRVTVHQGDPAATAYPDSFANLVVSGRSVTAGPQVVAAREMWRLQRPYGGVACIGKPAGMSKKVRGPLEGAGTWTHQYADSGNTTCSNDALAGGPLRMLWFSDWNFQMPSRHGRGPAPLFLDGRLLVEGVDALRCVDAYNGRTLWEVPLPEILAAYDQEHLLGTAGTGSNFCVTRHGVYVRHGGQCLRIDPAEGRLLAKLAAPRQPDGKDGVWAYVACVDGNLFGTLADTQHVVKYRYGRSNMATQFTESILLFALDASSGELKWSYRPEHSIRNNAIAVAAGRVHLIDRPPAVRDRPRREEKADQADREKAGEEEAEHGPGVLIALDAGTGEPCWKVSQDVYGTMLAASETHDVLLMSYQDTGFKLDSEIGGRMAAFRASDGQRLWDIPARYGSRPIINGRTIYAQPGAWDLLTGEPRDFTFSRSHGCGILAGSRNLLLYRSATLGYTDLRHNRGTENYGGIRPGCWINAIPAGGLVLMPDATDRCTCSYLIKASIALQPVAREQP